mgnify:FL=1
MILLGDYHTHTVYSHGWGTIEDNVKVAVKKGLKQIAITDHGFDHRMFGVNRKVIGEMREEVERLKKIYDIDILLGLETNLISSQGDIDLTKQEEEKLDIVLMGYHKTAMAINMSERIHFFNKNLIAKHFGYTKEMIQKHTDAYLKALDKNNIDVE